MRAKTESSKWKFLFDLALVMRDEPSEFAVLKATPRGIHLADVWKDVVGTYALFNSTYFTEYQCEQEEVIPITVSLKKSLSYLRALTFSLKTDKDKIFLESENERYYEGMVQATWMDFPFEMEMCGEYLRPKKQEEIVCGKLTVDELTSAPSSPFVQFVSANGKLTVRFLKSNQPSAEAGGVYEITPSFRAKTINQFSATFNGEYLENLLSKLTGGVWICLDNNGISISQVTRDYVVCLLLASIV